MKKVLMSTVVATMLFSGVGLLAKTSKEVSMDAVTNATLDAKNSPTKIVKEVVTSVELTQKVLIDLDKKDIELAKKDLEKAIGKLEVVTASKDTPAFLPIATDVKIIDYNGDLKNIEKVLNLTKVLLKENKIQTARRLINTLQSEIDITTINLPIISYPQTLKLVAKNLSDGKIEEARDVLELALNTLVQNEIVIPLPILKAQELINIAGKIAKKDKKQALKHLELAREELKIAEKLGYTSDSDTTYKILDNSIMKIEKEIKGPNKAEKLFKTLEMKLKEFKEKALKSFDSKKM